MQVINAELREVLDEATDKWESKVIRVEIQKIEPPQDIVEAMSKQTIHNKSLHIIFLRTHFLSKTYQI